MAWSGSNSSVRSASATVPMGLAPPSASSQRSRRIPRRAVVQIDGLTNRLRKRRLSSATPLGRIVSAHPSGSTPRSRFVRGRVVVTSSAQPRSPA